MADVEGGGITVFCPVVCTNTQWLWFNTLFCPEKKKKGKKNIYTMFNISKYFQVLSKTLKVI